MDHQEPVSGSRQKASPTSTHRSSGKSVNQQLRAAFSPSPSPPRNRSRYDSPNRRSHSRSRSRSPYRGVRHDHYSRSGNPAQRGRSDERTGPRGRGYHEQRRYDNGRQHGVNRNEGRSVRHYGDLDSRDPHFEYTERERAPKRRRSRSPRHTQDHVSRPSSRGFDGRPPSRAFDGKPSRGSDGLAIDALKPRPHPHQPAAGTEARSGLTQESRQSSKPNSESTRTAHSVPTEAATTMVPEPTEEKGPFQMAPITIEERRRRRDEIRAKHKASGTPLLPLAVENSNLPGTPNVERSPSSVSPSTPALGSDVGSPESLKTPHDIDLTSNKPLARPGSCAGNASDGPVAADYDPTTDADEERRRIEQLRAQDPDTPGQDKKPNKEDVDMDDDDDYDMFAEESEQLRVASRPARVMVAKAIDRSHLDSRDAEGYYIAVRHELILDRYAVETQLGRGMFASVVRAHDRKTDRKVAIKIIRANDSMAKAAGKEIRFLQRLADADPDDKRHIVRFEKSFYHKGHLCMVFEHLQMNLRELLSKFGRDTGLNLSAVREYARQIFIGLDLLRKSNVLHADLKPDNILADESHKKLKICDLGSATDIADVEDAPYLVSRFYRAPEIILGIPFDFAIDMWAVGCSLFELATGQILFHTARDNSGMLKTIQETRGKISAKMLRRGKHSLEYFDDRYQAFYFHEEDRVINTSVTRMLNFNTRPTHDLKSRLMASVSGNLSDEELKEMNLFADLLDKCLALTPERRITPLDALRHPFIHREPKQQQRLQQQRGAPTKSAS